MKVLLTNIIFAGRTGTETATRDLALGLMRAGHEACVFSPRLGDIASDLIAAGAPVVSRLEDVPFRPDIIHGQHHVETVLALVHFRDVPAIFVCHDRLSWHDMPPRLNAVRRYVAVDRNCLERLVLEAGIPEEHTRVILNSVDLQRFTRRKPLPDRPARALVFSNYATENEDIETIRRTCTKAGITLTVAGSGAGTQTSRPEQILSGHDLVFAKARCALEALAAGCAVILYDWQGLGPMVTSGQIQELREWNLGMRCLQQRMTPDAVRREIARYDAVDAARVTGFVRAGASLDAAVADYVKLYEEALAEPTGICVSAGEAVEALATRVGSLETLLRMAGEPFVMPPLSQHAAAEIRIRVPDAVRRVKAGAAFQVPVEIDNRSAEVLASVEPYPVHLSYHWLETHTRRPVVLDGERTHLSERIRPRSRHRQNVRVLVPKEPGRYVLVLTMVQERQFWFDEIPQPVAVEWELTVVGGESESPNERMLGDVASWTLLRVVRDGGFANLGFVSDPLDRMLTFAEAPKFIAAAVACPQTACVLTKPEFIDCFPERIALAVAGDPRRCFFEIHNRLAADTEFYGRGFTSIIHPSARLHPRCWVDEKDVIIGAGASVGPNASLLGRVVVGERTVIQAGAVIGSAGFQSSHRSGNPVEMVHAGGTQLGADCHVFANAVIARGLFRQSTRIGNGCRIGNRAFVSHNCVLEDEVFVGHGAVVNGNVRVGANAWIGPGSTIVHGISIGGAAEISLGATVIRDVQAGMRVTGSLAIDHRKMLRLMADAEKGRRGE